ncbi:hypothetical protein TNCT_679401 [Trichonephila clavata]|uniref:SH3 domain-containing protein n=1 Tax=Trichonephila clavata TaxID=2740835 RepID=A0A8X6JKW9_TRICU|nr:hypothetical protein TNCT_679401 [Trichonephila clavata]
MSEGPSVRKKIQKLAARTKKFFEGFGSSEPLSDELAGLVQTLQFHKNRVEEMFQVIYEYFSSLKTLRSSRTKVLNMLCDKYDNNWIGKEDFCKGVKPETASMDEFISNVHDELMIPMVSQLCLYNECMVKVEDWKKKSSKIKDLKKKLDMLESSSNRDEAKIAKVREELSDHESTRSSLVDSIRQDVSKYTDNWILSFSVWIKDFLGDEAHYHKSQNEAFSELNAIVTRLFQTVAHKIPVLPIVERAENMVNVLKDYLKQVKEKIERNAAPKASTSKAADTLDVASCTSDLQKIEAILNLFNFDEIKPEKVASTTIIPEDLSHKAKAPIVSKAVFSKRVTSDGLIPSVSGKLIDLESSSEESQEENEEDKTNLPPYVLYQVRTTKKYSAKTDAELSFEEGDIISVIDDAYATATGFMFGTCRGKEGFFPLLMTYRITAL